MTMPREIDHLAVDGATVAFTDHDGPATDDPPLLLVHGGVFSDWLRPLVHQPALADRRVVRLVRAGYGPGPAPSAPVSITAHAAHGATVLDHLGIDRACLVAHSSGAVIALQLALDRPDLVDSLVLVEPPLIAALAAPEDGDLLRDAIGPAIGGAIAAAQGGDVAAAYETFMGLICGPDHEAVVTAALGPDGLHTARRQAAYFFADEITAVAAWPFDQVLADRCTRPVLLVQGEASPPPVHRLVARVAAMLPTSEVVTLPGDDHLMPLRSPAALSRAIAAFLATGG